LLARTSPTYWCESQSGSNVAKRATAEMWYKQSENGCPGGARLVHLGEYADAAKILVKKLGAMLSCGPVLRFAYALQTGN
jgi:hypothetical protein